MNIPAYIRVKNELRLHSQILKNLSEGVYLVKVEDLTIAYTNPKFEKMFGYEPGEMLGQHVSIINAPSDLDPKEVALMIEAELKASGVWNGDVCNKKKDGTLFWCNVNISAFDHPEYGRVWLSIQQDIDAKKQAEEALLEAKSEAEKANRAKSEFLAGMSHDLRTPLNAIIGFSEMMESRTFGALGDSHYDEYVSDILNSGRFLLDLINDILDLSKVEAGKYELAEQAVDMVSLIDLSTKQMFIQSQTAGVRLITEVPPDLPFLRGDKRSIVQILHNLISNAVKFTPENGTVTVSANINREGLLEVRVKDNGIGISEQKIAQVLEPFVQTDSYVAKDYEGHGLGLTVSNKFAEMHDGALTIESELGKGTIIIVRFPAERVISNA